MSNLEAEDPPDVNTCQKLTEQFAQVTGTDEALAQFYLQDRQWDLERSVNAFFEETQSGAQGETLPEDEDEHHGADHGDGDDSEDDNELTVIRASKRVPREIYTARPTEKPPSTLSLISWNLDGLDDHNLKRRTRAVTRIIETEKPDIVFLQELIPNTFKYLQSKLPEYMFLAGGSEEYFTATLLRRFTVYYDRHEVVPFPGTAMGRNLLVCEAHVGTLKLQLMNTHLESTAEHSAERIKQLRTSFDRMQKFPEAYTVIFGGDLNLRDKELAAVGGIPAGVGDLWQVCGSRKTCQYTWDTTRNTNHECPGRFKPRCRFDRLYLRHAHPRKLVPRHFGLVGIEKVPKTQSYPSDHWGLQMFFDIEGN